MNLIFHCIMKKILMRNNNSKKFQPKTAKRLKSSLKMKNKRKGIANMARKPTNRLKNMAKNQGENNTE